MNRRRFLQVSTAATGAALAGGGAVRYWLLPPARSRVLAPVDEIAQRFIESLDAAQRAQVCVGYEHPLRQYHNRGVRGGGAPIWGELFRREQRQMLNDLFHAGLSERGREVVPNQFFINWPGVHLMNVLVCGDPRDPPYQVILSGAHLMLRIGGASREGVAFGGPQVYGDQRGDGKPGLPNNRYGDQLALGERLFESLSPGQRERARAGEAPIQTQIELPGSASELRGVPLAEVSERSRDVATLLARNILGNYDGHEYAWECLEQNGGIAGLSLAYFDEGPTTPAGASQVFRLEGPAAVLYYRGAPHLHAFVNVARDADAPLSVGELLAEAPRTIEGADLKKLFEAAMVAHTGADVAYYPEDAVVGRLRAGPVRSGDLYTAESWRDTISIVELRGAALDADVRAEWSARERTFTDEERLNVAVTTHNAQLVGTADARVPAAPLRDAVVDYVRETGLEGV